MAGPFVLNLDELLFFLGVSLTIGYGFSFLLEKYGVPNVIVYLTTGFIIANLSVGSSITSDPQYLFWFGFVENITLGLIGFKIGIEMEFELLREQSKLITVLIIFEVVGAFLLVFLVTFAITTNIILSVILAGLATATAPAATIEVIRRLRAKGPVSQRLKWILAFDDVVAVIVVEAILSFLIILTLNEPVTPFNYLVEIGQEVGLALLIGIVFGIMIDIVIERLQHTFQVMEITFASLILVMGVAHSLETSVILSCMVVGVVTVNREGNNFAKAESYLDIILSPILIIFFLLVGAQVEFADFYNPFPILAILYLVARTTGKIGGIMVGAKLLDADENTRKYLGLGLLPQGGVALGLTSIAADILHEAGMYDLADTILVTIVISTVFSEGLGALATGFALKRVGEVGKAPALFDEIV